MLEEEIPNLIRTVVKRNSNRLHSACISTITSISNSNSTRSPVMTLCIYPRDFLAQVRPRAHLVPTTSRTSNPPSISSLPLPQTSAISLSLRIVLLVAAAAGVLFEYQSHQHNIPILPFRQRHKKPSHSPHRPRPPRHRLLAALAAPDPDAVPLDRHLATKGAGVAGVLADFHLLDLFAEGGAVSGWLVVLEGEVF